MDSDIQYPASDGNTYLDLSPNTTFDQIDSIVELDPLGDIKTESILGGTLPATGKNKAILNLLINPRDQKRKLLRVVAMNGHRTLNVNSLRVVFYDEESYEIEMIKDNTHWAVCASSLKLSTLDLEDFEFSADIIKQTWENYAYEEGDLGIYFPLAYYGATSNDKNWKVEDFRPAHSIPFLLKEGFCACGWDFSSPLFEGVGKQLWVYALGPDYGREEVDKYQWKVTGDNGDFQATGPGVLGGYDAFRSKFVGIGTYKFKLEMEAMPYQFVLLQDVVLKVYRQFQENGETKNNLIDEVIFPYPRDIDFGGSQDYFTVIDWEDTIVTVPGDDIVFTITYFRGSYPYHPLSEIEIPGHRYKASMEPDRKTYIDGDTLNIAKIIDPDVTLMDILKGVCHLFGRAKLYINNATKEIKLLPPFTTKWEDEVIEGFFKYDEQLILSEDILCDSMQAVGVISTTKKHQIKYRTGNNPLIEEDFQVRNVDFDNDLEDDVTEWENPSFVATINKKLPRSGSPRPPISWAATSDGIDIMMFTEYQGSYVYDVGLVPFIAYGSFRTYGELVDDQLFIYPFIFEDNWEDIPISGQKPNGYVLQDLEYKQPTPWLIYGEEPLKDLFSIFWREYFYKEQLSSKVSINVAYTSQQLAQLDYRKIYYVQYQQGFAGWLNRREFNYCKTDGTLLDFVPDLQIEPECIDPDTIPPVEDPCENTNTPEIEWEISEDCMLTYSQVGTIESNITGEQWLIRYEGQPSFSPAPPSPFLPDTNLYLRYEATTDDPNCTIPVSTVYINVCAVNVFELEVEYNELTDCYKIQPLIQGCNIYSDIVFEIKNGEMYDPVAVENPTDPVEDWYVEICEPEDDFCIRATPTLQEGCEIDAVEVCVNLCPKEEDVECLWEEVEGGFKFIPETNIHKPIQSQSYYYDFDSDFPNPTQFQLSDTLTMVGRVYFRAVFTFTDCPDLIVECEYERNSNDCGLNTPGYECQVLSDGRLNIVRTGNLVTEVLLDIIRYRTLEESEWQTWNGKPIEQCPVYIQRLVIYCNDCPNSCTEMQLCECDILPPPTPDDCDDFDVKLNRYGGTLYATPSTIRNDIIYVFYKDGVEVQNSTSNIYNGMLEDAMYRVKAVLGICEAQDSFEYDSGCTPPVIEFQSESNNGMEYTVVFSSNDGGNYQATHTYSTSENNEITDTLTVTDNGTTVEVVVTVQYGINTIDISSTTACGMDDAQHIIDIPCPEVNAGVNTYITICEGCWGAFDPLLLMEGDPDSGGEWVDVQETGALVDGEIDFNTLSPGTFEFIYIIDTGSQLCNRYASLFVEVVAPQSSGNSSAIDLCHDAGETDLLSLVPGSPDPGGEWYTDDVLDGDIDLVNGTITPAFTDIGKTITLAYSHTQETSELPDGVTLQECHYEFDGVNDTLQAQNNTDLDFAMPIKVDLEFDAISGDYIPILGKFTLAAGDNRYYMIRSVPGGYIGFGTVEVTGNPTNTVGPGQNTVNTNQRYLFEADIDGTDYVLKIDGVEVDREAIAATPDPTTAYYFMVGRAYSGQTNWHFKGKIYSFQVGTETFQPTAADITQITGSEGTVLNVNGATLVCEGVAPCDCNTFSLLTITIVDCTPPIPCPDDDGLGIDIAESANGSPSDPLFEDMLTFTKTGTYEDAGVIDTDDIYFSNDDGATWIKADEAKDGDYYVKLSSGFQTTCSGGAGTGSQRMTAVTLSTGEDIQEGQVRSRNGNFNNNWTDIESGDSLIVAGSSASLIAERYFRWDVRHVLNSGWELHLTRTIFDRGSSGGACPNGIGSFGISFYSGNKAGKRKILIERRITYNNGCDPITIPEEFNPTLPDCPEASSDLGFTVLPPQSTGGGGWIQGSVTCKGTVAGSTSDTVQVFFQASGSPGYGNTSFGCGGSYGLDLNENYVFHRIIQFADCPPIILMHNYNAPASCPTASLSCERDNANSRARAARVGTPFNLSSDYMQYRRGSGTWQSYTEGQWVSVTGTTTVTFRRVANYNNGCPQTTQTCSTTVTPPNYSLSISCSGGNTIVINAVNMPPGGVYHLYRSNVLVGSNSTGANFPVTVNGVYEIRYRYNQYQYIYSNTVTCGTGGGCDEPTISIGACNVVNGNEMQVPFTTTNITSTSQIDASVDPGSGSLVWNSATGQGTMTVIGTPGQTYTYEVIVTNSCGSDTATRQCQVGCSTLSFQNVNCNFSTGQTTFDVVVSPDTGVIPTTNGTYLSKPSSGRYRFRINQTSGTITASHPSQCTGISQSINCNCPEPIVNLDLSCSSYEMAFSFTVTNPSSITGDFKLKVDGFTYTISNTGATSYNGIVSETGLSHNYDFYYTACGQVVHKTGTVNCSCIEPTINASASCAGTTVNYSFSVNNESQIDQNYSVLLNGSSVATVVANSSGTYNGSVTVPSGSNNTIRIQSHSVCGNSVLSNVVSANCACPPASLSISNVSCNSSNQMLTFTINQSNVTGLVITVNGNNVPVGSNPYTVQGLPGNNTISVQAQDSCAGTNLSDSVNYNCGCDQPSISVTASCNTSGLVSYSFTVTNENLVNGNYSVIINGSTVKTITKTGAGTYNNTYQGSPGMNYSVRISAPNNCGSNTLSNIDNTNCGCPTSVLSISNVSCNPSNQQISFNFTDTNVSNVVLRVNGTTINHVQSNPITVQGQIGSNSITATATDPCTGNNLSDSKTINCLCNNNPSVTIGTVNESGGTITVNFSTTNISNKGQITFRGNGTIRTVTGSGGSWSASFPAINGTNTIQITVSNSCGQDSDSDTYSYSPCVAPTITKVGQGTLLGGSFYVDFVTSNCTSISAPGSTTFVNCNSTRVQWNPGSSTLNWSITVTNACGSDSISGSYSPCTACTGSIVNLGCSSAPVDIDFIFVIDGSTSILSDDHASIRQSTINTVNSIQSQGNGSYRFAVGEYSNGSSPYITWITPQRSGNYFNTYANTSSDLAGWTRQINGCARWPSMLQNLSSLIGSGLNRRPGAMLHLIILHDSIDTSNTNTTGCSATGPYSYRNNLLSQNPGMHISVVRYEDPPGGYVSAFANAKSASMATPGGSWTDSGNPYCTSNCSDAYGNPSDPNRFVFPRRFYYRPTISSGAISDLVSDSLETCQLRADLSCSNTGATYSWSVIGGGGSITGSTTTRTISTNGSGEYQVVITASNGCQYIKTYDYSMFYTKRLNTKPGLVHKKEPEVLKATDFTYDYSQLKEEDNQKLQMLFENKDYKAIQKFYNSKVISDYFFSCGCDNNDLEIIVKKYLDGLEV